MSSNLLSNSVLFLVLFFIVQPQCKSPEIRYNDLIELTYDNFWIDNNTLQLQVEGAVDENIPYSMRRDKACLYAENNIDERFLKLYPGRQIRYTKMIYKRLYTEKNNCRLVVHLYVQNFKEKIK